MKKHIALSAIVVGLLGSLNVQAADDLASMFSEGKTSGQIREFSISRSVEDTRAVAGNDYTRDANAIGGHLKFETAAYNGLSFATALYTTNGFLNDDPKNDYKKNDPTLLGENNEAFSVLGEAYLAYNYQNTTFKGGRQKLNTPLAGADDVRMLPNLFEAYLLVNTDLPNTTLIAGHITAFAQGTFGRAYNGGVLAATAGYSARASRDSGDVGSFENMGTYATGTSTNGVSVVSATYTGVENLKVQLWDYYAHDILNAIYGEASYSWTCLLNDNVKPFAAAQFVSQSEVGDKHLGQLSGFYWGAKVGAKVKNFTAYLAYSQTSENGANDATTKNAIISPWGGMPAYTQGMVTRHIFLAGTKATKLAASYNWKAFGPDLKTVLYHASYDMAQYNGYTNGDAKETGFDFIYKPAAVKNLNLRLRGNYADDFYVAAANAGTVSWDEYRLIVNYNF